MVQHSFKLKPEDALRLGFAPGAFGCPVIINKASDNPRDGNWERRRNYSEAGFARIIGYIIVGLDETYSTLKISKDIYRNDGKRLRSAGEKVYSVIGNIRDLGQLENSIKSPCADDLSTIPYDAIKSMLKYVIGEDITGNKPVPTSLSIINSILDHIRKKQKDHARLLYHWPIFFEHFRDNPTILDRAVKGESLWDALEQFYPRETIEAAKKIKFFSFTWNNLGMSLTNYLKYILFVMSCQPKGAPGPQNEEEARLYNQLGHRFISTFNGFENGGETALKAFFANKNWKKHPSNERDFHNSDYTRFLRDNLIRGIRPEATDEQAVKIIMAMHGNQLGVIAGASAQWHRELRSFKSIERKVYLPKAWPAPFQTVQVPGNVVPGGLSIVSLHTRDMLSDEGDVQHHCVAYHDRRCASGQSRAISIRHGKERLSTATILNDGNEFIYEQHRGFANHAPCGEAILAATWFLEQINKGGIEFSRDWPNLVTVTVTNAEPETLREQFSVIQSRLAKKYREGGFVAFERLCHTVA